MKKTLLAMVQDILSETSSDEVNSIEDTPEAVQIVQILENTYYEMVGNRDWKYHKRLTILDHGGDILKPTHLKVPQDVKSLEYFAYDKTKCEKPSYEMQEVFWKEPDEFLRICSSRTQNTQNVETITDYGGTQLVIRTNAPPQYWTSFDDQFIVCDGYQKNIEDTLQAHKTQAIMTFVPKWETRDDFVPDLPIHAFPAFLLEAKGTAFYALKQMFNEKVEAKAKSQQRWLSRKQGRTNEGVRYPNYGRGRSK